MIRPRLLPLFLFLLLLATTLPAQNRDIIANTIGIGPRAGWYSSNDAEEGAWYFGVMGRIRLGENLGIEAAIDYRTAERFSTGLFDQRSYDAEVAYMPFTASAMIFVPFGSNLAPYALAGLGWYYTLVDYDVLASSIPELRDKFNDENSFVPGYHFGLGCEIVFSKNFAIHADARYLFLGTKINSISDAFSADIDTKNSDGLVLSFGFMVYM